MNATATKQAKFRVMGENDDASECACCGRQGLRRVVWMQPVDEHGEDQGIPIPFGRVCASNAAGWGYGTKSAIDRKVAQEMTAARAYYGAACSRRVGELERAGLIVQAKVVYGFDWKSATYNAGYIYILPGDRIEKLSGADQAAEVKHAKARRDEKYPVCRIMSDNLPPAELKRLAELA